MRKKYYRYLFICCVFGLININAYALPFSITVRNGTTLPTVVNQGETVTALYTIRNNTGRTLSQNFVKYLPDNVSQVTVDNAYPDLCGSRFNLASGGSCTLELMVSGAVSSSNSNYKKHLFVCNPQIPDCTGTHYPLNVRLNWNVSGTIQSGVDNNSLMLSKSTISGAQVKIYGAGLNSATLLGQASTDSDGKFYIYVAPTNQYSIFYALVTKNNTTTMAAILGTSMPSSFVVNELTTVAAAYSFAQFMQSNGQIYGAALGLQVAAGMNDNLVKKSSGTLSSVITSSPNADQTNSMRSLNALSNLIAPCIRQQTSSACQSLFNLATYNGNVPTNTLQALLNIAHYPANNVTAIYNASKTLELYTPVLEIAHKPDAWTLAVKVNDSGSDAYLVGGPAKLVFDRNGYAWVTNNVVQGTADSSEFMFVLKPNGKPADGTDNTVRSPVLGGGIKGQAFGITIDGNDRIWAGNFGWGSCDDCLPNGSVSAFSLNGSPLSGSGGFVSVLDRTQGTAADQDNNIWMASYANDKIVVFPQGDPNAAVSYDLPSGSNPFEVFIDGNGAAWVSCSGTSKVNKYTFNSNTSTISQVFSTSVGDTPKGVVVDSQGNGWVASGGDSSVYKVSSDGLSVTQYTGIGGMNSPWGISLDGNENVLVANFGSIAFGDPGTLSLTMLCGINTATCPPNTNTGQAISPSTGYTLPSAGSQILLHDGSKVYDGVLSNEPVYRPLMRLTYAIADRAGNVWTINNWRPRIAPQAPGGDGIVIFVGLAKPKS